MDVETIKMAGGLTQIMGPLLLVIAALGGATASRMVKVCYLVAGASALSGLIHAAGWMLTNFGLINAGYGRQEWHLALAANLGLGLLALLAALIFGRVARADANRAPDT